MRQYGRISKANNFAYKQKNKLKILLTRKKMACFSEKYFLM